MLPFRNKVGLDLHKLMHEISELCLLQTEPLPLFIQKSLCSSCHSGEMTGDQTHRYFHVFSATPFPLYPESLVCHISLSSCSERGPVPFHSKYHHHLIFFGLIQPNTISFTTTEVSALHKQVIISSFMHKLFSIENTSGGQWCHCGLNAPHQHRKHSWFNCQLPLWFTITCVIAWQ